jgi:shikimate kinase
MKNRSNIVLIGMPGAGKSTVGVVLAKLTARNFVDTDLLIQTEERRTLQDIVDHEGYLALRSIEERVILSLHASRHVIATGGSAAYSDAAMRHLQKDGVIVFLHVTIPILLKRIHDIETRGIARRADQSFEDLFEERFELYSKYADVRIDGALGTAEDVAGAIAEAVGKAIPP